MGTSTNAMLVYGIDLGELTDEGLERLDEAADLADGACDVVDLLQAKLPEGVSIETHCSESAPMYLLATKVITARRGYPEFVNARALSTIDSRWDPLLAQAMDEIGLKERPAPAWLLCSWWSS